MFPSPRRSKIGHFQDPKKEWHKIIKKIRIEKPEFEDFRIHDMRRTMGSWMAIKGANEYIIGKALGHQSPKLTAVYARVNIDPVRKFMQEAADSINNLGIKAKIKLE